MTGRERIFPSRMWRLYHYFRGHRSGTTGANVYRRDPASRRHALWLAWGYARKGSDFR